MFDTSKSQVFSRLELATSDRLSWATGLAFVTGDEVSTATPTLNIINNADAIEADSAFGGIAANRLAYRLPADSLLFDVELNFRAEAMVGGLQTGAEQPVVATVGEVTQIVEPVAVEVGDLRDPETIGGVEQFPGLLEYVPRGQRRGAQSDRPGHRDGRHQDPQQQVRRQHP